MLRGTTFLAFAAALGLAIGCGEDHGEHGHSEKGHGEKGHSHGAEGGTVTVPDHYSEAVHLCEELSDKIGGLISSGKLSNVHAVAADITKIAEKLPALAKKDLKPAMLKQVNIKAKELAGMFDEIDEAADAGKKKETIALHKKMKGLIAHLKEHASDGHGKGDGHGHGKGDGHDH